MDRQIKSITERTHRVPHRFGTGTILVVMTAFSILFAVLKGIGVPIQVFLVVVGMFVFVGVGQGIFNKRPRKSSAVSGAIYATGIALVLFVIVTDGPRGGDFRWFLIVGPVSAAAGAGIGYLVGTLVASVFMMIDLAHAYFGTGHDAPSKKISGRSDPASGDPSQE